MWRILSPIVDFLIKQVVSVYTTKLKTCIVDQIESQPKLFASHTISNKKTDEVFTNLRIIRGKEPPIGNSRTNTRSKNLEYYLKDSGTLVEHRKEIFLGTSDAPKNPKSILVIGKAGIGKSLFCQKVVRDWAKNQLFETHENKQIPNFKFVSLVTFRGLNALKDNYVTLREFLDRCSALSGICMDDVIFEYIVNHPEEVLIILDGFDEYSQKDYIAEKSREEYLNDARSKMPVAAFCSELIGGQILKGCVVVVTTRPEKMSKLGRFSFEQSVVIVGFSSEQVKQYIEKDFKGNEERKNAVLKHVMNSENLVSFAHIPMLCFLLCLEMEYTLTKSENPYDLPVSTTDIYTKLIDIFELKHWAKSQYRQNPIPEKFKYPSVIKDTLEKLSELAAELLLESKPTFDESEIEGGLEVEEVEELIGSGLLYCGKSFRPDSSDEFTKNFSFTHLTVQEFLAARWFVKENRIPGVECSDVVYQFMAGILSTEGNEELMVKLMEKLTDSRLVLTYRMIKCLSEYQDKGFAKRFIRNHPQMFRAVGCDLYFDRLSDVDIMAFSFVLDIISELNEEGVVAAEKLVFHQSQHTMSGIKRVCGSLNNEHCPVSELELSESNVTDEWVDVVKELVVSKLTMLNLYSNEITDAGVASLCEVLQKPSCKLTTLSLVDNKITDTGVASLCEALQHPSCKLTTLALGGSEIANTGVASLCEALQHPNCKLTTLVVVRCKITDTCIATLCKALQQRSCKLTTLNLGDNMITDTGIASLRAALQHPSCKVASLILGGNKITDTGVSGLCETLQHPICKVASLILGGNKITSTGVSSLCKALQHQRCKLTTLHLGSNEITDPGVASLCEALQDPSCKLTALVLPESINHECRENLQAITQKHRPALDLSFSHWEYDPF